MTSLRLDKREKLRGKTRVDGIFVAGTSVIAYPLRAVFMVERDTGGETAAARFLVSIPKKKIRHAVDRVLLRRRVWDEIGGLDEVFAVSYNDIDLCLRLRRAGYLIVWTPFAELYHRESASRRATNATPEAEALHQRETALFSDRWQAELAAGDPYYNPSLRDDRLNLAPRSSAQIQKARCADLTPS